MSLNLFSFQKTAFIVASCTFLSASFDSFGQACPPRPVPYLETFESYTPPDLPPCHDTLDIDGDGLNWMLEKTTGADNIHLRFQRMRPNDVNEGWYFSEGIRLDKDTTYTFRCLWISNGRREHPTFHIYMARDKSLDSMLANQPLLNNNAVSQPSFIDFETDITPSVSGVYYFGFYGKADDALTQGINISIDDVSVRKKGAKLLDAAVLSMTGMDGSICADNNAEIEVVVANTALMLAKDILLDFTYTGPSTGARSYTLTNPIAMGNSETVSFSGIDLSQTGTYDFEAVLMMTGDELAYNDTLRFQVQVVDKNPDADSIIINSIGGTNYEFDVANPQDAFVYKWNFGDGNTSIGKQTSHSYNASGQYTVTLTIENGCGEKILSETIIVGDVAGIYFSEVDKSYSVYPNPADNFIRIANYKSNDPIQYSIVNMQGLLLRQGEISRQPEVIETSEWAPGLYFLRVQYGSTSMIHKIQVIH